MRLHGNAELSLNNRRRLAPPPLAAHRSSATVDAHALTITDGTN